MAQSPRRSTAQSPRPATIHAKLPAERPQSPGAQATQLYHARRLAGGGGEVPLGVPAVRARSSHVVEGKSEAPSPVAGDEIPCLNPSQRVDGSAAAAANLVVAEPAQTPTLGADSPLRCASPERPLSPVGRAVKMAASSGLTSSPPDLRHVRARYLERSAASDVAAADGRAACAASRYEEWRLGKMHGDVPDYRRSQPRMGGGRRGRAGPSEDVVTLRQVRDVHLARFNLVLCLLAPGRRVCDQQPARIGLGNPPLAAMHRCMRTIAAQACRWSSQSSVLLSVAWTSAHASASQACRA